MAGETFQLRFRNNEDITVSIDEPINFATVDFQLSQKEKGYGRDVSFNGGEIQFEFVKYRNHYLDKLIEYNKTNGFESIVELIITTVVSPPTIIGELDFATAVTDDLEYFKCKVIQQSSKQIVKRRNAVKVDLLSDKDVDGNPITPLVPQNMIMIAKPIYASSRLEQQDLVDEEGVRTYGQRTSYKLWCRETADFSINNTLVPINDGSTDGVQVIYATTGLKNVKIDVSEFTCTYSLYNSNGGGDAEGYFGLRWGTSFSDVNAVLSEVRIPDSNFNLFYGGQSKTYTDSLSVTIPLLPAGAFVWIYHSLRIEHAGGGYSAIKVAQSLMTIDITAESLASDSVVLSFRLIDVMRQVVKSISGLNIDAPRFDVGGDFYDNRLVNGNFLRKITTILDKDNALINKAFLISLEDLEKSLVEWNCDWQITDYTTLGVTETKLFFGIEDDFYTNEQIKLFENKQFSSFNKSFNPRFTINEFNYGYKSFQALKENEEINSADVINGKSKWVFQNKSVENKKEISIEWIRDSFLIETNRRKATEIRTDTSSQEDDSVFIIDSKSTTDSLVTGNSDICSHYYNGGTEYLELQGTTNFDLFPFNVGDKFYITSTFNLGEYIIRTINNSKLELERQSDASPSAFVSTYYTYNLGINDYNGQASYYFTNINSNRNLRITHLTGSLFPVTGDVVTIGSGLELGQYEVLNTDIPTKVMDLKRIDDLSINTGISTSFNYKLNPLVNPFTSYTNDGFSDVKKLVADDKFANLRYSIRRNIEKYWKKYISTCNLYKRTQTVNNTVYENNKYFTSTYDSLTLTESEPITTAFFSPILSPFIYNEVIFANVEFSDFVKLQNDVRKIKGYIKTYDNKGLPILLYPITMKYENLSKQLTIKAEEKFTSTFVPTIETLPITEVSSRGASSGGNILSNGYLSIINKGVVWGTSSKPTVDLPTKTTQGTGNNSFVSRLTSLTPNTLYYARAYATNANGAGYGAEFSFTSSIGDYSSSDYTSSDYSTTI